MISSRPQLSGLSFCKNQHIASLEQTFIGRMIWRNERDYKLHNLGLIYFDNSDYISQVGASDSKLESAVGDWVMTRSHEDEKGLQPVTY